MHVSVSTCTGLLPYCRVLHNNLSEISIHDSDYQSALSHLHKEKTDEKTKIKERLILLWVDDK